MEKVSCLEGAGGNLSLHPNQRKQGAVEMQIEFTPYREDHMESTVDETINLPFQEDHGRSLEGQKTFVFSGRKVEEPGAPSMVDPKWDQKKLVLPLTCHDRISVLDGLQPPLVRNMKDKGKKKANSLRETQINVERRLKMISKANMPLQEVPFELHPWETDQMQKITVWAEVREDEPSLTEENIVVSTDSLSYRRAQEASNLRLLGRMLLLASPRRPANPLVVRSVT
eukprot:Gb_41782 [translate_table: standard]